MVQFMKAKNAASGSLASSVSIADPTIDLDTGEGANFPDEFPFNITVNATGANREVMRVTNKSTDTLTVTKGQEGTADQAHDAAESVELTITAKYYTDLVDELELAHYALNAIYGGGDVVIRNILNEMEILAQGTPDMTVVYSSGLGYVSNRIVKQASDANSAAMTAPTGNPRIDIVQWTLYTGFNIKTGSEGAVPSAPAVDSNSMKVCEIYHRVGETSIKDTDDSVNGYITDARTFG